MASEAQETRADEQIRGSPGFSWVSWEICMGACEGTEVLADLLGPVCHSKDFDLERAVHRCLRGLNEVINIIYSARNCNYVII